MIYTIPGLRPPRQCIPFDSNQVKKILFRGFGIPDNRHMETAGWDKTANFQDFLPTKNANRIENCRCERDIVTYSTVMLMKEEINLFDL